MRRSVLFPALLCALIATARADTPVSGTIRTTTWTKSASPYRVTGEVTVPPGDTLTIEPGVDVLFDVDVAFRVQGRLSAIGTEVDSIRFLRGDTTRWKGIRVTGSEIRLRYARISGAISDAGGGLAVYDVGGVADLGHCTISGNRAEGTGPTGGNPGAGKSGGVGGGVYFAPYTRAALTNCRISGNSAKWTGGGISLRGALARITQTEISGNSSDGNYWSGTRVYPDAVGGGLAAIDTSELVLDGCVVRGNKTNTLGGGIFLANSLIESDSCVFADNQAIGSWTGMGGVIHTAGAGGGIYGTAGARIHLCRSHILGNVVNALGGGMATDGVMTVRIETTIVRKNRVVFQTGPWPLVEAPNYGGGLVLSLSDVEASRSTDVAQACLVDCTVDSNASAIAILAYRGRVVIDRCAIRANSGDGVAFESDTSEVKRSLIVNNGGIGMYVGGVVRVSQTTIAGNRGAGILKYPHHAVLLRISGSIIHANALASITTNATAYSLPDSVSALASWSIVELPSGVWWGPGNLNRDPLFADTLTYALAPGSPAIDAGDPASPRDPDDSRADIGAIPSPYGTPLAIKPDVAPPPFALYPVAPNPFNPSTAIRFSLARAGDVRLAVYDVNSRRVRTLVDGPFNAGPHEVAWDGRDTSGRPCASGVYLCRLTARDGALVRRMVLLK